MSISVSFVSTHPFSTPYTMWQCGVWLVVHNSPTEWAPNEEFAVCRNTGEVHSTFTSLSEALVLLQELGKESQND